MTLDTMGLIKKNTKGRWSTEYYVNKTGEIVAKQCRKCEIFKEMNNFNRHRGRLGGRATECKKCRQKYRKNNKEKISEYNKQWRKINNRNVREYGRTYYEKNRERRKNYSRQWREDNKEKVSYHNAQYYKENREQRLAYHRKWRKENRELFLSYIHNWQKTNKNRYNLTQQRRRARKNLLPDTLTSNQYEDIMSEFDGRCALTRVSGELHLDHVIPIAVGHGGTIYGNMIPLRADLNISKSNRNIFDWFADNKERFNLEQRKFDELIEYLAEINGMTTKEYEEYVRWCHDNPRTIDEIKYEETNDEEAS